MNCIKNICYRGKQTTYTICLRGTIYNTRKKRFVALVPKDSSGINGLYLKFNIQIEDKRHRLSFHREMLKAFRPVDNMDNLEADHINGDCLDNHLDNLQWLTKEENLKKRVWDSKTIPF
jgi:hypothetical protein